MTKRVLAEDRDSFKVGGDADLYRKEAKASRGLREAPAVVTLENAFAGLQSRLDPKDSEFAVVIPRE